MRTFNNIEEMKEFYNKERNEFYIEDDIELKFNFECPWNINAFNINANNINGLRIKAWNIKSGDINAGHITARNINADDINANKIDAGNISFYAVCVAYTSFKCNSIEGRRKNSKYFCLDSDVEIKGEENE